MDDDVTVPEAMDFSDVDFSAFSENSAPETPTAPTTEQPPAPQEDGGINPAWAEYLKDVPESLHKLVTPAFSAWDKSVQDRFSEVNQKWEPWKVFQEQNLEPDYVQKAVGVAQRLQSDPLGLYASLHQFVQQSPQHLQQAIQMGLIPDPGANKQEQEQQPNGELGAEDPIEKVRALEARIEQMQQEQLARLEEQQIEQQYNQAYEETIQTIESDFAQIEQRTGALPDRIKAEIIQKAQLMGQQEGRYVSVIEAAPVVFQFIQQARAGIKPAPRPVGSGGVPQNPDFDPTSASEEERMQRIREIQARFSE